MGRQLSKLRAVNLAATESRKGKGASEADEGQTDAVKEAATHVNGRSNGGTTVWGSERLASEEGSEQKKANIILAKRGKFWRIITIAYLCNLGCSLWPLQVPSDLSGVVEQNFG